jgi:perosamine synthetase
MYYKELEDNFAKFIKTKECVTVNTGTAALHVALEALKLPPNSKVIVPEFTMYASALAVHYARLTPVFIDCDDDLLIDLDKVEEAIDSETKVLMVTHIYGRVVDMKRVMDIAKKYNLRVIEDACEAQGAKFDGKMIGSFDIGCFSFYANKIIHGEEGGAITTDDVQLANIIRDMKSMAFGDTHDYFHKTIGFNYRMTNSQSKLILESLSMANRNINSREAIKNKFNDLFSEKYKMQDNREVVWVYDMKHPKADTVVKELKNIGVNARHSFKPMSMMPLFDMEKEAPNALQKSKEVFYLHINPEWDEEKVIQIFEQCDKILKQFEE